MYRVQLENFQGPLDLLLFFIRRDEIDIYDIPIARITREFVDTLDIMHTLNISIAGEFINMAATLMQIKARMLLPRSVVDDLGEIIDPRTELVKQLLEYQRFKELAGDFGQLETDQTRRFPRQAITKLPDLEEDPAVYLRVVTLYDLARFFKLAMDSMPVIQPYELTREPVNLDDQKAMILRSFAADGSLSFSVLIGQLTMKIEVVVTFMAILDLIRLEQIKVYQNNLFGDLKIQLITSAA